MNNSGLNTVLLLIVLALIAAGVFYYFSEYKQEQENGASFEVTIPLGDDQE